MSITFDVRHWSHYRCQSAEPDASGVQCPREFVVKTGDIDNRRMTCPYCEGVAYRTHPFHKEEYDRPLQFPSRRKAVSTGYTGPEAA